MKVYESGLIGQALSRLIYALGGRPTLVIVAITRSTATRRRRK
jgi:hypothetical protein